MLCLKDAIIFIFFGGAPQLKQEITHEKGITAASMESKASPSDAEIELLLLKKWRKHSECDTKITCEIREGLRVMNFPHSSTWSSTALMNRTVSCVIRKRNVSY